MNNTTEELRSQEVEVKKTRFPFWVWALVPTALSGQMLLPLTAWGQAITPDGTLPTQVMQDGDNYTIEGGGRAGGNLFHSFDKFSVPAGGRAFFNNAADVENILSRVTGGNVSNIDGWIRANGNANLFLINPAGIVFGPNAHLVVGGSFLGSTASSLLFPDGTEFSATNQETPLLTINAPIGLQFRGNEGNIELRSNISVDISPLPDVPTPTPAPEIDPLIPPPPGTDIRVPSPSIPGFPGTQSNTQLTITLVGGNVRLDGGRMTAIDGRINLGGLAAAGTVGLNDDGSLSFPDGVARGNVSLVDVRLWGAITVNSDNLEILETSLGFGENIMVDATGVIVIEKSRLQVNGDITIEADSLSLTDTQIDSNSVSNAQIRIITQGKTKLQGGSIVSDVAAIGESSRDIIIESGDITIEADSLSLTDTKIDAQVSARGGFGNGGQIRITTQGETRLQGGSIASNLGEFATGSGGDITIEAGSLYLTDTEIDSNIFSGRGTPGQIRIITQGETRLQGGSIRSALDEVVATSSGGDITIEADSLYLTDTEINSSSSFDIFRVGGVGGSSNASQIRIATQGETRLQGGSIRSDISGDSSIGSGGDITIEAASLSVKGTEINANTSGQAEAGNIVIMSDVLSLAENAAITVSSIDIPGGSSGNIDIQVGGLHIDNGTIGAENIASQQGNIDLFSNNSIVLQNNSTVSATTVDGRAGTVTVNAPNSVTISGESEITSSATGNGRAGDVSVTSNQFIVQDASEVAVSSAGTGDAGNLNINAGNISLNSGSLSATTNFGGQGNIQLTSRDSVALRNNSTVSASTSNGQAGSVTVNAPNNSVILEENSQISSSATGNGTAGNVGITTTAQFILRNGSEVTVSSQKVEDSENPTINMDAPNGQNPAVGNLRVDASEIFLDNGTLSADTGSQEEGNITLNAEGRIELRNDSTISTDAVGTATGGNITISTEEFLIAFPEGNNDIRANAQDGPGGKIEITADGLLGIDIRERPKSSSNDITARSETGPQGDVTFNTPNADIIQGLVELSENVVDPNEIVAQTCRPNRTGGSSLIETGRGGLPPTPYDPLTDDTIRVGGEVTPPRLADLPDPEEIVTKVERTEEITSDDIQPARGWFVNEKGNIVLTPYPTPNATGRHPGARPGCGPLRSQK
ncbi:MAG: filamentous hemagglutinin N-terminal domain-containing protein [Hormoscilla sp.]